VSLERLAPSRAAPVSAAAAAACVLPRVLLIFSALSAGGDARTVSFGSHICSPAEPGPKEFEMQAALSSPQAERYVRLVKDIPELGLRSGAVGVICSTWFEPSPAYEVEFQPAGLASATRALLLAHQIQETSLISN
jgi:hypothetical protein